MGLVLRFSSALEWPKELSKSTDTWGLLPGILDIICLECGLILGFLKASPDDSNA